MTTGLKKKHVLAATKSSVNPSTAYQAKIIADGAIAYWPLDDAVGSLTARELKGILPGTIVGGVTFGATGKSGKAADFDGTTGYIIAGATPSINLAGSSYEAWIYLRSMPDFNYATVVGRDNAASTGFIYASLVRLGTPGGNPNISTQITNINSTTQLSYNTWYHLVLTHNGGTSALFYLNGVLDSILSAGISAESGIPNVYIGTTKGPVRSWNGLIQDVAIYSKVLTPAEISSHYALRGSATLPFGGLVSTASLISYWKLDEVSGNRLDSHGTNHLTPINNPTSGLGKVGNGCDFEASSTQHLSCVSNATLQSGDTDFTLALWLNLESAVANQILIDKAGEYALYINGALFPEFQILNGSIIVNQPTPPISAATWYWIVAWHDSVANTLNLQINNGTPISVGTSGGFSTVNANVFSIGTNSAGSFPVDGLIDEVGFWKRVLTPAERTALYNSGNGLTY